MLLKDLLKLTYEEYKKKCTTRLSCEGCPLHVTDAHQKRLCNSCATLLINRLFGWPITGSIDKATYEKACALTKFGLVKLNKL